MLFLRKTDETVWNPPFLREPPPLSTNPPISEQFFHDPPSLWTFPKTRNPPPLILGGEETLILDELFAERVSG